MKRMTSLLLLASLTIFGACYQDDAPISLSKAEAAAQDGKSDSGSDWCELFDWYGDSVCDTFCPLPDPDCTPEIEPPEFCGGFANIQCDDGFTCVDDPDDDCDLDDGADCGGICVESEPAACGGFAGIACADGFLCVDDPSDDCQPLGADCIGICVAEDSSCPDPLAPEVDYIGESVSECAALFFQCEPWQQTFSGPCGCGCIGPEQPSFCGGFANIECASGLACVDDPSDDCDPSTGADCGGICVLN